MRSEDAKYYSSVLKKLLFSEEEVQTTFKAIEKIISFDEVWLDIFFKKYKRNKNGNF